MILHKKCSQKGIIFLGDYLYDIYIYIEGSSFIMECIIKGCKTGSEKIEQYMQKKNKVTSK